MDLYLDKVENYIKNVIFPGIYHIIYVIRIYLLILLDKYNFFQHKHTVAKRDHLPLDFNLNHDNIYVDFNENLVDSYSELRYGKLITSNIRLDINDNITSVCIISETINPYFVYHLALNMKNVYFHVYTKNRDNYKNIKLDNISLFYIDDIYDTKELYERMYVGLHVCSGDYENYYENLKRKVYTNGKMVIQNIVSINNNSNNIVNLRNTITFRNFFNNKYKSYGDYLVPPLCKLIKKYSLIDIIPLQSFENDVNRILNKHKIYTQEYDFLFKIKATMKLMGYKYYVACFEY